MSHEMTEGEVYGRLYAVLFACSEKAFPDHVTCPLDMQVYAAMISPPMHLDRLLHRHKGAIKTLNASGQSEFASRADARVENLMSSLPRDRSNGDYLRDATLQVLYGHTAEARKWQ